MPNIFKQSQQVNDHPKRNNFDLSKKINASFKFGTLYPVYCQPVVPGDSFSIDTAFNIKAMPVVFPVQTKMRAHMHYFYVRNKNLWQNWENWISNLPNATQDLTPHPYVSRPDSEFSNGSIHDFLGVPTSLVSNVSPSPVNLIPYSDRPSLQFIYTSNFASDSTLNDLLYSTEYSVDAPNPRLFFSLIRRSNYSGILEFDDPDVYSSLLSLYNNSTPKKLVSALFIQSSALGNDVLSGEAAYVKSAVCTVEFVSSSSERASVVRVTLSDEVLEALNHVAEDYFPILVFSNSVGNLGSTRVPFDHFRVGSSVFGGIFTDYSDLDADLYSDKLHINVLPYRAYESIFNAYYRNNVVDPLTVDGQVQYNKFIPNDGDGADTFKYELHQRNYELDFLTSALPSPQQGVAPMVGVTALGDITIEDENGLTTARADVDDEGFVTKVVLTSPAASNDHARTLMNIAASGFNINDFRQTNALQRLLETSIRKGYKYKDFIAGHFGIEPKYVELDMPEFIGGFSRDVSVSTVVSNADTLGENTGAALGEYGGYAQVVGGSNHSVRHYCDDYGFIMGILCITPTPCYSQLLPKHMIAPDNFLDYPFPEFNSVGMQPITYKEVAPIQCYIDSLLDPDKRLEDTFGYQRPNYDMVAAVDEVHGDFRGSLRNYVINRIFDTRPELGHDFIAIRPDEINDIFVDTDPRDDTFLGEIAFGVHAKRPFPRVVIPNLGR